MTTTTRSRLSIRGLMRLLHLTQSSDKAVYLRSSTYNLYGTTTCPAFTTKESLFDHVCGFSPLQARCLGGLGFLSRSRPSGFFDCVACMGGVSDLHLPWLLFFLGVENPLHSEYSSVPLIPRCLAYLVLYL